MNIHIYEISKGKILCHTIFIFNETNVYYKHNFLLRIFHPFVIIEIFSLMTNK